MAARLEQSPSPRAAASPSERPREGGFSLIEVLVSTVLLVVGLASVAQLLGVTIRAESMARNGAEATRLAQARLDALMKVGLNHPSVAISPGAASAGSLDTNVTNFFDTPAPNTIVRWRVQAGPANTRVLTARVLVANGTTTMRVIDLGTLLRNW